VKPFLVTPQKIISLAIKKQDRNWDTERERKAGVSLFCFLFL